MPLALLLGTLSFARFAQAAAVETTIDNDTNLFVPGDATTDRNYTQGGRITWFADPGAMPGWADGLANRLSGRDADRRFGCAVGQEIYTPDAISSSRRILNDRPYAGWLYLGAFVSSGNARRERTLELSLGLVGPRSYAQEAQMWWHESFGIRAPRGWQWQLRSEPGVQLRWQERRRPWGYHRLADVVPHAGLEVGNVLTYADAGTTLRVGLPLPDDFGPSAIAPPGPGERGRPVHAYLFARADGRAVARSVFLDGNTLSSGPRVHRIPLVGEAQLGGGVRWRSLGLRYAFSYTTNQFRERPDSQEYGSFAISF